MRAFDGLDGALGTIRRSACMFALVLSKTPFDEVLEVVPKRLELSRRFVCERPHEQIFDIWSFLFKIQNSRLFKNECLNVEVKLFGVLDNLQVYFGGSNRGTPKLLRNFDPLRVLLARLAIVYRWRLGMSEGLQVREERLLVCGLEIERRFCFLVLLLHSFLCLATIKPDLDVKRAQ